ncbi:MAG: hypothetical protein PHT59_06875, partial [Candidatus Omnitrophica bacterium]|nr:hypothetical protein [Candidatus Omnitrophota bacterium]
MLPDRTFQLALTCSLAVHATLIVNYANLPLPMLRRKPVMVQIAYLKNPPQLTEEEREAIKKAPSAKLPAKPTGSQTGRLPLPSSKRDGLLTRSGPALKKDPLILKPVLSKPDIIAVKKKITLPPIDMNKINNPSYVSY